MSGEKVPDIRQVGIEGARRPWAVVGRRLVTEEAHPWFYAMVLVTSYTEVGIEPGTN